MQGNASAPACVMSRRLDAGARTARTSATHMRRNLAHTALQHGRYTCGTAYGCVGEPATRPAACIARARGSSARAATAADRSGWPRNTSAAAGENE